MTPTKPDDTPSKVLLTATPDATPRKAAWTPSRDPAIGTFLGQLGMQHLTSPPPASLKPPQTPLTPASAGKHASRIQLIREKSEKIKAEASQRLEQEQRERQAAEAAQAAAARERAHEAVEEAERKRKQVERELEAFKAKAEEERQARASLNNPRATILT